MADEDNNAPDWLDEAFLETVLRTEENDASIEVTSRRVSYVVAKGDNYLSVMLRVEVDYKRASGRERVSRSLVVKSFPVGEFMKSIVEDFEAFKHETNFYVNTLPAMVRLTGQKETARSIVARNFHCPRPNTLVMEDLKPLGFRMCDRRSQLDFQHCSLTLRALAKLHAMSVALYKKDPTFVDAYKEKIFAEDSQVVAIACVADVIKDLPEIVVTWEGFERFGEKLGVLQTTCIDRMIELLKPKPGGLRVLNHGDLWTNNILFRYSESTGLVEDVRLVDFQLSRFCSPTMDLHYFLTTSPKTQVRNENFEQLLRVYHTQLCSSLKDVRCDDAAISFEELLEEMKRTEFYSLITATTILTAVLADPRDAFDLDTLTEEDFKKGDAKPMAKAQSSPLYRKIFGNLLLEFEKKGII